MAMPFPPKCCPPSLTFDGVTFKLAPAPDRDAQRRGRQGTDDPLFPPAKFNRVYVLAASADGDQKAAFRAGGRSRRSDRRELGRLRRPVGQPHLEERPGHRPRRPNRAGSLPRNGRPHARLHQARRHRLVRVPSSHGRGANVPYGYSYLFAYAIDLPAGAKTLTLPDNDKIRVLAVSVAETTPALKPAQPLYDTLER